MERITDSKFQKLSSEEMKSVQGGKWVITEIHYPKSPDRLQIVTRVHMERVNWLGKVVERKINEHTDATAC